MSARQEVTEKLADTKAAIAKMEAAMVQHAPTPSVLATLTTLRKRQKELEAAVTDAGGNQPPPQADLSKEKEIFFDHLRNAGQKKTAQRELILEVFLKTEGHLSAEDLYNFIKTEDPTVGFTTVYRTLKLLAECGLAREERLGDGHTRYEHLYNHQHHDHLICTECGQLIEFYSEVIERKQDEIAAYYKFQPTRHSLRIWGVCADCQAKRKLAS